MDWLSGGELTPVSPISPVTPVSGLRLVMASANPDKVAEIEALIASMMPGTVVVARPASLAEVDEDADSLIGNARLKARAVMQASGEAAISDDTGLEVGALGGEPGLYSARYAGPDATYADNVAKLLNELARVGAARPEQRGAVFRTVAMVVFPNGGELHAEGHVHGWIAHTPSGSTGFGYDPVFIPHEGDGRTFAELGMETKQQLSHRGRALRALFDGLRAE